MPYPLSNDLREPVVAFVEAGNSCNAAARHFHKKDGAGVGEPGALTAARPRVIALARIDEHRPF
jgi:hypothetical protein